MHRRYDPSGTLDPIHVGLEPPKCAGTLLIADPFDVARHPADASRYSFA